MLSYECQGLDWRHEFLLHCVKLFRFVNAVGINEEMMRRSVKYREEEVRKEKRNQQGFDFEF